MEPSINSSEYYNERAEKDLIFEVRDKGSSFQANVDVGADNNHNADGAHSGNSGDTSVGTAESNIGEDSKGEFLDNSYWKVKFEVDEEQLLKDLV